MRRKPIILILLVLLLLAGGGAEYYYLQSREPETTAFTEVKEYFQQIPATSSWTVTGMSEGRRAFSSGPKWLEGVGYRRVKEYHQHTYWFANNQTQRLGHIQFLRDGEHIILIDVFSSTPADAEDLSRVLTEKFPRLLPIVKRYP